jgi:hypothetical protein
MKIVFSLILFFLVGCQEKKIDELIVLQKELNSQMMSLVDRYKIYKTQNIHTSLKLDTASGKIEILQISLDKHEGTYTHSESLIEYDKSNIRRFKLYSTPKMYQFILLDTFEGGAYRIQWGTDSKTNYRIAL